VLCCRGFVRSAEMCKPDVALRAAGEAGATVAASPSAAAHVHVIVGSDNEVSHDHGARGRSGGGFPRRGGIPPQHDPSHNDAAMAIRLAGYVDGPLRLPFVEVPKQVIEQQQARVERWKLLCEKFL
jgi:hypothetical protein